MVQPEVLRPASEYIKKAFTHLLSTCEQPSLAALPGSLTRVALVYRQCGNGIWEGGQNLRSKTNLRLRCAKPLGEMSEGTRRDTPHDNPLSGRAPTWIIR